MSKLSLQHLPAYCTLLITYIHLFEKSYSSIFVRIALAQCHAFAVTGVFTSNGSLPYNYELSSCLVFPSHPHIVSKHFFSLWASMLKALMNSIHR